MTMMHHLNLQNIHHLNQPPLTHLCLFFRFSFPPVLHTKRCRCDDPTSQNPLTHLFFCFFVFSFFVSICSEGRGWRVDRIQQSCRLVCRWRENKNVSKTCKSRVKAKSCEFGVSFVCNSQRLVIPRASFPRASFPTRAARLEVSKVVCCKCVTFANC